MKQPQPKTNSSKPWLLPTILTVIAGIIYCSWPLGIWLNPAVGSRGLASELEALHQPYNWLFITLDILSGLLVCVAVGLMWHWHNKRSYRWLFAVLVNFALFGIFTAIDAILPLRCTPSTDVCQGIAGNPLLIAHGFFSVSASVCLFVSVAVIWWLRRKRGGSTMMALLIAGWTLFGILSLIFALDPSGPGYWSQHYYITLCSIWTAILPYAAWRLLVVRKEIPTT